MRSGSALRLEPIGGVPKEFAAGAEAFGSGEIFRLADLRMAGFSYNC